MSSDLTISFDWSSLSADVKAQLDNAYLSGISDALLTGSVSPGHLINAANGMAAEYAKDQAADLLTSVSDTTRDKVKAIIAAAMSDETTIDDLIADIDESGIFSDDRARMIARTEVNRAELGGNIAAWRSMGNVELVDWVCGEENCDQCQEYEDGGPYTLAEAEALLSETHPNCRCGLAPHLDEED